MVPVMLPALPQPAVLVVAKVLSSVVLPVTGDDYLVSQRLTNARWFDKIALNQTV
jgi:hypothetical protein